MMVSNVGRTPIRARMIFFDANNFEVLVASPAVGSHRPSLFEGLDFFDIDVDVAFYRW